MYILEDADSKHCYGSAIADLQTAIERGRAIKLIGLLRNFVVLFTDEYHNKPIEVYRSMEELNVSP